MNFKPLRHQFFNDGMAAGAVAHAQTIDDKQAGSMRLHLFNSRQRQLDNGKN